MPIFRIEKGKFKLKELISIMIKNKISERDLDGEDKRSAIFIKGGSVEIDGIIEKDPEKIINTSNINFIRICPNTGWEENFTIN